MRLSKFDFIPAICLFVLLLTASVMNLTAHAKEPNELTIIQHWRGDYPVSELNRLPEDMRSSSVGYIDDPKAFGEVWEVFQPGEKIPEVDFGANFVIFARNTDFYNRMGIAKIFLTDGVTDIIIMQTLSALPIEEKVGLALAVIPKAGISAINAGSELIPVTARSQQTSENITIVDLSVSSIPTSDTLNVTCMIEGLEIPLRNGRSEVINPMDSNAKIRTWISGNLIFGDLDNDGDDDAVFILIQDSGGSGTFYYVAAAVNTNGQYFGTNAVLLGDRIVQKNLQIRNTLVIDDFLKRRPDEAMSFPPEKISQVYMVYEAGALRDITVRKEGEQLLEGWIRIGHEVRSFQPCFRDNEYWIDGDSPALKELMTKYGTRLAGSNPTEIYEPLYAAVVGIVIEPPLVGFGAEYAEAFYVTQLIRFIACGQCLDGVNREPGGSAND